MNQTQRKAALRLAAALEVPTAQAEDWLDEAAALLRELAAEPQSEPVATLHDDGCFTWKRDEFRRLYDRQRAGWRIHPYAHPPQRLPLTEGEIIDATEDIDMARNGYMIRIARAVEAAHDIGGKP